MKLSITKIFSVVTLTIFFLINNAALVLACAPDVVGRVVTNTGAPVAGVWVKWTDYRDNVRYEQTDSNGNYYFPTWTYLDSSVRTDLTNRNIDTNKDGTNDTKQAVLTAAAADDLYKQFECGSGEDRRGHSFSVVKPVSLNGTFTSITGKNFNCGEGTEVLPDLVFTPSSPPPTPTPTPTGLLNKKVNFGLVPISGISGLVFIDSNINGVQDAGELPFRGITQITLIGVQYLQTNTDSGGNYSFSDIPSGAYKVLVSMPTGYSSTSPTSVDVAIPPPTGVNFGIAPSYIIKGSIYNDINKNLRKEVGENPVAGAQVQSSGGFYFQNFGDYEIQDLLPGNYTVRYITALPAGFQYLYPVSPPAFTVTVGGACSVDNRTGASCNSGNIDNLNFAISDSWPWVQTYGLDVRFDNGIKNLLPASTSCGSGSFASGTTSSFGSPGIIFTGDRSPDFGQGQASSNNRIVGGIAYPEVFNDNAPLKTSVRTLLASADKAGIAKIPLDSISSCQNPSSSCNLQGFQKGFYHTSGDLRIDHSANFNSGNYVIIAEGTITIANNSALSVTSGSTLLVAAGRDLVIEPSVGASSKVCPVPAGQIQGIYSANRHIIIDGNDGDCSGGADKMLNIDGALIVNAGNTGGRLDNERDLCADNRTYPSLTVKSRPDFILNIPGFITHQQNIVNEETP